MKRFLLILARNAFVVACGMPLIAALTTRHRVIEIYSSPPFGGTCQVYVDNGGWVVYLGTRSQFGTYLQCLLAPYEKTVTPSMIDFIEAGTGTRGWNHAVGGVFLTTDAPDRIVQIGVRHSVAIAAGLLCAGLLLWLSGPGKRSTGPARPDQSLPSRPASNFD